MSKRDPQLDIAISFARLELLELDNGRRELTQCPGIEQVAAYIADAKKAGKVIPLRRSNDG